MRVLYFTKYSRLGASSRLRSYQYFPFLEDAGISVSVSPLFGEEYLQALYQGKASKLQVVKAYVKRFFCLFTVSNYDKIVIEKELFPYFFSCFEWLLSITGKKYVVDYDDAIFHNYDLSPNPLIRFFFKHKIDSVMRYSSCVLAGNSYLAARAEKAGARKIVLQPTVIDLDRYPLKPKIAGKETIIGWIGSPSTYKYVQNLQSVLEALAERYDVRCHIVGAQMKAERRGCFEFIPWSEVSEVSEIDRFDIGLMPLADSPWELGKCSYKLIQYMGCGVPVVASPIGMNVEVVTAGKNGFFACTDGEWFAVLEKLILDESLRKRMGVLGRAKVELNYCLQQTTKKLISILKNVK